MAREDVVPWSMARTRPSIRDHTTRREKHGREPGPAMLHFGRTRRVLLRLCPALHELVIGDGLALRLLVLELGGRAIFLAEPLGRVLRLVEARTAAAIGVRLLVGGLHAGHDVVHLAGKPLHGLL